MQTSERDPLLTAGKFMSRMIQVFLGIGMAALIVALPIVLFSYKHVAEALAESGSTASLPIILSAITIALIAAFAVMAAGFHFFQLLCRIIDTVKESDPFIAINAERLSRMGWLTLAIQLVAIPMTAIVTYLALQLPTEDLEWDAQFSLSGILLAVILFILARVFRHGAAMRDDLEGTV